MCCPGAHRLQGVGNGHARIVVGVDANRHIDRFSHNSGRRKNLMRQRPAIGVAQHHTIHTGRNRGLQTGHGKCGIVTIAVKEMLCIEKYLSPVVFEIPDGVADHRHVFLERRAQHVFDMEFP